MRKGEIEGRFDPNFYRAEFQNVVESIDDFGSKKLFDLVMTSSESWNGDDFFGDNFPYIEISEIDIFTGEVKSISSIPKTEAPSRAKMIVRNDDILVSTTRPNRGAIAFVKVPNDEIYIASTGFAVLRSLKSQIISKEFLFFALRQSFSLKQMEQRSSGGNYPAITGEELQKIKIPVPLIEVQKQIIEKFETAYEAKRRKEAEAQNLLDGIDAYLLDQLGIETPAATETKKTFFTRASKLSGGRFDPEFVAYQATIKSDKYPTAKLKQLLETFPQYGANESGIERTEGNQPRYIRITDIDELGRLDESDLGKTAATIEEKYILQNNDLLFARSGNTVGKCYLHKSDLVDYECFFAGYMIRFIIDKKQALPDFIFYWTQTKFYKDWVIAIRRAAGQPNINAEEYKSLPIPLPSLEIQEEIAAHIGQIRQKTKDLQREANGDVEQAKAEVERMILGEI